MRPAIFETKIEKLEQLGEDLRHFTLRFNEDDHFEFTAGQFATIIADGKDGKPVKRAYSIASSPNWKGTLDIFWKKVDGGVMTNNHLWPLKEGDGVRIQAPLGHFYPKEVEGKKFYFVSTGTGFAPFRAMIHDLLERNIDCEIINIYGNRYEDQIFYKEELEALEDKYENLKNIFTVSRPQTWTGETEYVQHVLNKHLEPADNVLVYICGLSDMIADVEKVCQEAGLTKEQIQYEKYD